MLALLVAVSSILLLSVFVILVVELLAIIRKIPNNAELLGGDPLFDLVLNLLLIILMIPVVAFAVRFVQKRRFGSLSSVEGRLRWSWLWVCALVSLVCVALSFGYLITLLTVTDAGEPLFGEPVGLRPFLISMAFIIALVPFQAAAEEYATRGFLMQLVGSYGSTPAERAARRARKAEQRAARTGAALENPPAESRLVASWNRFLAAPLLGILVSGLVFTVMHDYLDWALADVALFGLAMAWLTWYTGGLEAAITLHVVHNLGAFGFSAYEGLPDPSGSTGSWEGLSATAIEIVLYCLIVVWLARRRGLRRTTPGRNDSGSLQTPARHAGRSLQG
ncbi:hypothetical protein Nans01_11280 [Nocardiopsis ansamitocini]|uniref:CAAX prenyl protease 2/Lysostaphin resistance protein A-like domain-containing protein n=1 Tax=Nocardiopsis ansamitocini TaxID=1670832 RepID=A0A9W6P484_9ACTN|nr:hypothetical protein Nans01_11280 [Nocardiopsis ansamitocini]